MSEERLTGSAYITLEQAYEWFNSELFANALPSCLITLQRHARSRGYFANDRFRSRAGDETAHELALNPDEFEGRNDKEILSTLVHEMCHCWQQVCGAPSRSGYHNREWAAQMVEVGLMPSDTGTAGGKQTGQRITHYIVPGGRFDRAADALLQDGFELSWQSFKLSTQKGKGKANKTKYTCPDCGLNAWAKPEAHLVCGECSETMEMEE